jgi:hypothetical protein
MSLTHRRCQHLLPPRRRYLGRIQYLAPIQNSDCRCQHHELNRPAVFHLRTLNQLFLIRKTDERTSLTAPY